MIEMLPTRTVKDILDVKNVKTKERTVKSKSMIIWNTQNLRPDRYLRECLAAHVSCACVHLHEREIETGTETENVLGYEVSISKHREYVTW